MPDALIGFLLGFVAPIAVGGLLGTAAWFAFGKRWFYGKGR